MKTITVIIPTFNEEDCIYRALHSVKFADEIIIIDSYSTDNTVAIAKQFNCKIIQRQFDNFSAQKNHALQFATMDWVLFLDADERITSNLQHEIIAAVNTNKHTGFKLNFPHFFMNRFLYHHSSNVTRLVERIHCHFKGSVHEKLVVKGSIGKLNYPVLHYTYKGLEHYIKKRDIYAWFQAEQLHNKGKKVTYLQLIFKPFFRFFSSYILKRGFLDGIPGLAISGVNAYGVFSRYAKLLLIQKQIK